MDINSSEIIDTINLDHVQEKFLDLEMRCKRVRMSFRISLSATFFWIILFLNPEIFILFIQPPLKIALQAFNINSSKNDLPLFLTLAGILFFINSIGSICFYLKYLSIKLEVESLRLRAAMQNKSKVSGKEKDYIESFKEEIENESSREKEKNDLLKTSLYIGTGFSFTIIILIIFLPFIPNHKILLDQIESPLSLIACSLALCGVTGFILFQYVSKSNSLYKIDALYIKKRIVTRISSLSGEEYLDGLVTLNLEHLFVYYSQVEKHTNRSFITALVFTIVGFLLIACGAIILVVSSTSISSTIITVSAGIISQFIAGTSYLLYKATVAQMKKYHDDLLSSYNILLSFRILTEIKNKTAKDEAFGKMIDKLIKSSDLFHISNLQEQEKNKSHA